MLVRMSAKCCWLARKKLVKCINAQLLAFTLCAMREGPIHMLGVPSVTILYSGLAMACRAIVASYRQYWCQLLPTEA